MECSICLELINKNNIILECNHNFHRDCLKHLKKWNCPICRMNINVPKVFNIQHAICNSDISTHYGFGYAPVVPNGFCRFCTGKPI